MDDNNFNILKHTIMSLIKYNNGRTSVYPNSYNSLLDRFFTDTDFDNTAASKFNPSVDILESDKTYEIQFAVPGFEKDSFNIEVEDKHLIVSGERKFSGNEEDTEQKYKSVQTQYGAFRRSFILPDAIDRTKIDAQYTNGILAVTLPKDEVKTAKSTIKVK